MLYCIFNQLFGKFDQIYVKAIKCRLFFEHYLHINYRLRSNDYTVILS